MALLDSNRYRDLIHSADSIIEMDATTKAVRENLLSIEEKSQKLQHLMRTSLQPRARQDDSLVSSRTLAVAVEIKELVDTPERIWVALEKHDFLSASDMYLEAFARYERLHEQDQYSSALLVSSTCLSTLLSSRTDPRGWSRARFRFYHGSGRLSASSLIRLRARAMLGC